MRSVPLLLLSLVSASILSACGAGPRATDDAAFVTRLGNDTIAVERFMRTADGLRAEVALRIPRTSLRVYDVRYGDTGAPVAMTVEMYDPATGLSGEPLETREVDLDRGSGIPFIDMVHWPFELMLRRTVASGEDSLTLELVAGSRALPFRMAHVGPNRYTAAHPSRGTMDVEADDAGRLIWLDAGQTTRALYVERRETVDVDALARAFAARDERDGPMGSLSGRGAVDVSFGGANFEVDYGRPSKRGRDIFGGLVSFGEVWRTGADRATHFSTSRDLRVGDDVIPAGEYTLFSIPQPERWTLMINQRTGINGQSYNAEHDLLRLEIPTRTLDETVEQFTIDVVETGTGGELRLQWDRTEAYLPFEIVR